MRNCSSSRKEVQLNTFQQDTILIVTSQDLMSWLCESDWLLRTVTSCVHLKTWAGVTLRVESTLIKSHYSQVLAKKEGGKKKKEKEPKQPPILNRCKSPLAHIQWQTKAMICNSEAIMKWHNSTDLHLTEQLGFCLLCNRTRFKTTTRK